MIPATFFSGRFSHEITLFLVFSWLGIVKGFSLESLPGTDPSESLAKISDGIYYSGNTGKREFFIRINKSAQSGEYFFITGNLKTTLHSFEYRIIGNKLIFSEKGKVVHVNLEMQASGDTLTGSLGFKRKLLGFLPWFSKFHRFRLAPFDDPLRNLARNRYLLPVFKQIDVQKDIIYGRAEGYRTSVDCENPPKFLDNLPSLITKQLDLKMDIYSPVGDSLKVRPLVLLIHGGGFYIGNKECKTNIDLSKMLAGMGYVVAAIDYRIGFQPTKSSIKRSGYRAIQDGRAALRFLSYNHQKFGIDPMNVILMGTSAGAITSLNIAFLDEDERPDESKDSFLIEDLGCLDCSGNNYLDKFSIKALVNMWGAVHDLGIIDKENLVPVLSVHGDLDETVPYEFDYPFKEYTGYKFLVDKMYGSKLIDETLRKKGMKSELITFRGFKHEPHLTNGAFNINYDIIKQRCRDFLYSCFSEEIDQQAGSIKISLNSQKQVFEVNGNTTDLSLFWTTKGGFVLGQDHQQARVIWFDNVTDQSLEVIPADRFLFTGKSIAVDVTGI